MSGELQCLIRAYAPSQEPRVQVLQDELMSSSAVHPKATAHNSQQLLQGLCLRVPISIEARPRTTPHRQTSCCRPRRRHQSRQCSQAEAEPVMQLISERMSNAGQLSLTSSIAAIARKATFFSSDPDEQLAKCETMLRQSSVLSASPLVSSRMSSTGTTRA